MENDASAGDLEKYGNTADITTNLPDGNNTQTNLERLWLRIVDVSLDGKTAIVRAFVREGNDLEEALGRLPQHAESTARIYDYALRSLHFKNPSLLERLKRHLEPYTAGNDLDKRLFPEPKPTSNQISADKVKEFAKEFVINPSFGRKEEDHLNQVTRDESDLYIEYTSRSSDVQDIRSQWSEKCDRGIMAPILVSKLDWLNLQGLKSASLLFPQSLPSQTLPLHPMDANIKCFSLTLNKLIGMYIYPAAPP